MRMSVADAEKCVGCMVCMFACARQHGEAGLAGSRISVSSAGGMARGFIVVVCRGCSDPPCLKACPYDALEIKKKGGVRLDSAKCMGCGACVDACALGAVFWDAENSKPIICVSCGYCAKYCPHSALALDKEEGEDA